MLFPFDVSMVMFVPACAWLRDKEALYAAYSQPCRSTPRPPATHVATARCDKLAHDTTHEIYE